MSSPDSDLLELDTDINFDEAVDKTEEEQVARVESRYQREAREFEEAWSNAQNDAEVRALHVDSTQRCTSTVRIPRRDAHRQSSGSRRPFANARRQSGPFFCPPQHTRRHSLDVPQPSTSSVEQPGYSSLDMGVGMTSNGQSLRQPRRQPEATVVSTGRTLSPRPPPVVLYGASNGEVSVNSGTNKDIELKSFTIRVPLVNIWTWRKYKTNLPGGKIILRFTIWGLSYYNYRRDDDPSLPSSPPQPSTSKSSAPEPKRKPVKPSILV